MHSKLWYVSYGSNMAFDRLSCYILGGRPEGGSRANPGCRDRTLPERDIPVDLPGTLYFAGESPQWGGGVAFYDHERAGYTAARGYLVTPGQLADIATQEMYRDPYDGNPLEDVLVKPIADGAHTHGDGRYEMLVEVGRYDGLPLLTFTSPHGIEAAEHNGPSPAYRDMLATGLRESRGWDADRVDAYLDGAVRTSPFEG
ncbi:MAG: histone deacetylase [Nocardioidaceae bacterium]|nr:histone deacetylase [Nocardioidaceae bacterium]NUS50673.1 histone deacetylase [Nocardioidaceae bacterium]